MTGRDLIEDGVSVWRAIKNNSPGHDTGHRLKVVMVDGATYMVAHDMRGGTTAYLAAGHGFHLIVGKEAIFLGRNPIIYLAVKPIFWTSSLMRNRDNDDFGVVDQIHKVEREIQ